MDPSIRLRLAARIHFALLRHYDEDVPIATLLEGGQQAQEALWVCEASGDTELRNLAIQFSAATQAAGRAEAEPATAPQDAAWARNTSGFGVSRPAHIAEVPPPLAEPGWRHPLRWLRGGTGAG
jgi:hypothetical protein